MDKDYEQDYFKQEKEHWWFQARRDLIKRIKVPSNAKILEVGCGSGLNLKEFSNENKIGLDISQDAVDKAKEYNINAIQGDLNKDLPFEKKSFDIIFALDVIEHLEDEKEAIKKLTELLKENGKLIINIPAFQFLWSEHDVLNQHKKRYTKKEIEDFTKDFLKTQTLTYWNFTLLPVVYSVIKINKILKRKDSNIQETSLFVNIILLNILKIENYLIHNRIFLPWGVSVFYIGKKRSS